MSRIVCHVTSVSAQLIIMLASVVNFRFRFTRIVKLLPWARLGPASLGQVVAGFLGLKLNDDLDSLTVSLYRPRYDL